MFGVVGRLWFLGLDLCLGCGTLLVMASGKILNLSQLQASPAQEGDDTIPTIAGGLSGSWCVHTVGAL